METRKPKFKSLNIYVKDYNEAIEFYEDMGFIISRSKVIGNTSYTDMVLTNTNDFTITIIYGYPEEYDGCISLTIHERMPSGFKGKSEYNLNDMSLMSFDCKDLEG